MHAGRRRAGSGDEFMFGGAKNGKGGDGATKVELDMEAYKLAAVVIHAPLTSNGIASVSVFTTADNFSGVGLH